MFGAMRLLGKTAELVRFPEESHDLSRNGRPDRRVERLRRIGAWFERFLGTAPADRPAPEEETQVLTVPAEASREWAKTIAISTRPPEPAFVEEPADLASESEVIQPAVSEFATAAAPIVEPEALPDLPGPLDVTEEPAPDLEDAPAPPVAEAVTVQEPVLEPEPFSEPDLFVPAAEAVQPRR